MDKLNHKPTKYLQPEILLMDLEDEVEIALSIQGYDVSSGSFGTAYKVPQSDAFVPITMNHSLPEGYRERDIVIIDLAEKEPLKVAPSQKDVSDGELDWWAKCSLGAIDPRPKSMANTQERFDRILANGGIFIVFAAPRLQQTTLLGKWEYDRFVSMANLPHDNWSFLSFFDPRSIHNNYNIDIKDDQGQQIILASAEYERLNQLKTATFNATFESILHDAWTPLAKNKFGETVAGRISFDTHNGHIFVLPHPKSKAGFLRQFITEFLPELRPDLFPHVQHKSWLETTLYEFSSIHKFKAEIEQIEENAKISVMR